MIIDQLFPTASDNLTDEVPVEQGTSTFKTTWQKILNLFKNNITASDISSTGGTVQGDITDAQGDITTLQGQVSGKADLSAFKAFTVTLASGSWSNNVQTVSNGNFVASGHAYIVSPASASFVDYGTAQIYADDVTTSGQMTFHCVDTPSSALTVNITRVVSV